mmetsp:Transcript_28027/g.81026  ORF Transcript_28027/g.81026 Transcript_28027/m.81026 type:complete len:306 (+) Transcript_28027:554-1471(+)
MDASVAVDAPVASIFAISAAVANASVISLIVRPSSLIRPLICEAKVKEYKAMPFSLRAPDTPSKTPKDRPLVKTASSPPQLAFSGLGSTLDATSILMGVSDGMMISSSFGLVLKRSVIAKLPFFAGAGAAEATSSSTAEAGAAVAGAGAGPEDAFALEEPTYTPSSAMASSMIPPAVEGAAAGDEAKNAPKPFLGAFITSSMIGSSSILSAVDSSVGALLLISEAKNPPPPVLLLSAAATAAVPSSPPASCFPNDVSYSDRFCFMVRSCVLLILMAGKVSVGGSHTLSPVLPLKKYTRPVASSSR